MDLSFTQTKQANGLLKIMADKRLMIRFALGPPRQVGPSHVKVKVDDSEINGIKNQNSTIEDFS